MKFKIGDKIELNETQKIVFTNTFMGGKEIETIVKIDIGQSSQTRLWMSNGYWINPERVILYKEERKTQ